MKALAGAAALAVALAGAAAAETPVERGRYLVETIMGCGNCHSPITPQGAPVPGMNLAGRLVEENPVVTAWAPNLTPAARIAGWSDAALARAIREGIRPDGSVIGPFMPIWLYRGLADSDLAAVVAYLRTLPPVPNEVPQSVWRIPLPESYGPPVLSVPDVPRDDVVAHGAYLAGPVAHCMECHTPQRPEGGPDMARFGAGGFEFHGPWGISVSGNLTPHADGIARWTDDELFRMITTGTRPDGTPMLPPMGYAYYAAAKPEDIRAIIAYLRTLPPLPDAQ